MSKKRRMFDIQLPPEDAAPEAVGEDTFPAGKVARRGPMAAAISETAESSRQRAEAEAAIRAENDQLAQEHVRLKRAGLITDLIPLDAIDTSKLIRDRLAGDDYELGELVESIREIGLSNPIRVEPRSDGRYELIQGFRRLSAFRALLEETGDADSWGRIPAGIVAQGDELEVLYRRMVDENAVRKDISFYEMAQLAVHYAMDPGTAESDPDKAVAVLFKSASYQKRSYIRSFIKLVDALDGALEFPQEIPRALGLSLVSRMEEIEGIPAAIRAEVKALGMHSVREELDLLRRYAGDGQGGRVAPKPAGAKTSGQGGKAKTTFQLTRPQGAAKCVAANGRIEVRLNRDFTAVDRRRLEDALRSFLDQIE